MYDDPRPKLLLVRNRETGLYWRGTRGSSLHKPRDPWTDDPAKAWKSHQGIKQVRYQYLGHFPEGKVPEYDIIAFEMSETGPAWDKDADQDANCVCGHTYERHFDTHDRMRGVGCKYCPCEIFRPEEKDDA